MPKRMVNRKSFGIENQRYDNRNLTYIEYSHGDKLSLPPLSILPMLVTGINNDVSLLQVWMQAIDHAVANSTMG